jgi:hypothetical protein
MKNQNPKPSLTAEQVQQIKEKAKVKEKQLNDGKEIKK